MSLSALTHTGSTLSLLIWLPLLGAVLQFFLPKDNEKAVSYTHLTLPTNREV